MNNWRIFDRANLNSYDGGRIRDVGTVIMGDDQAHEWVIEVTNDTEKANLAGYGACVYVLRPDGLTVVFDGTITGNVIRAAFPNACYVLDGLHTAVMRISKPDAERVTIGSLRYRCVARTSDENTDPSKTLVSIGDFFERAEEATNSANTAAGKANTAAGAANTAAGAANTAAGKADTAAGVANTAASAANTAAGKANTAANRLSEVGLEVEMLPPSAEPTASVTQTDTKTLFELGIPTSNLAYATFYVDDEMNLLMNSPAGFDDITFVLTDDAELEVQI